MAVEAQVWGWWEPAALPDLSHEVLAEMAPGDAAFSRTIRGEQFALAVCGGTETYGAWLGERVAAVCYGHFRWRDADLDALANSNPARAAATAYLRHGAEFVARLEGTFSCAIVDRVWPGRLVLVNDRMGVEPLCYASIKGAGLVFATHAENLTRHPAVADELDYQALHNYLYFTRVPAPRTIFKQVRKFSTATRLVATPDDVRVDTYWRMPYRESAEPTPSLHAELYRRLDSSVRKLAVRTDGHPLGAFLSGGLDSSTVSGLLVRAGYAPDLLNIGFDLDAYNESDFARQAADHFDYPLTVLRLGANEVPRLAERIAEIYDEPFANSSAVASLYAAEAASERGLSTLFAGDGGDELFAGNDRYVKQLVFEQYFRIPAPFRRALESRPFQNKLIKRLPILGKMSKFAARANIHLPERLESYNFYHGMELDSVYTPDLASTIDPVEPSVVLQEHYFDVPEQTSSLNRMMHLDLRTVLADDDLRKVTKTCRACGVAVRYPMLTEEVVEFAAQVPTREQVKRFELRHFYKRGMKDFLPPATLTKRKQGFGLPFAVWVLRDPEVRTFVSDHLRDLDTRKLFRPEFLEQVRDHPLEAAAHANGEMVWVLLMLELWLKKIKARALARGPGR